MPFPTTHPALARALTERGYAEPTPVQVAVLAEKATTRDLLVSARTGSGKTVAFGLVIAPNLLLEAESFSPVDRPLALVVAPTRELAIQVRGELAWLYAGTGARIVSCVGGMDPRSERRALQNGAHIVVGTPGRLCDHLDRGALDLAGVRALVLDEADEMLDLGFRDELEHLMQATPDDRRTLMFSATLPSGIRELAKKYQTDALRIDASPPGEAHADIDYKVMIVAPRDRELAVVNVLRYVDPTRALVFCATREGVGHLHSNLVERGFSAVALSGELSQAERTRALQALRDGRARVCVATDVAARGLDLPDLALVVHADLPHDAQVLRHRSGRTGRAGKKGVAVVLCPPLRRRVAERIFQMAKIEPQLVGPPSAEAIVERDQERLAAEITGLLGPEPSPEDRAVAEGLLAKHDPAALVAALVSLHRRQLPAPEDLPDIQARKATKKAPPPKMEDGVWFKVNIGRDQNADPRWLIPLICTHGNIAGENIGRIKIQGNETRFELAPAVAEGFEVAAQRQDPKQPRLRFAKV